MTCPFCGNADIPAHARFCSNCGTALLAAAGAAATVAASDPVDDRDTLDELYDEKAAEFARSDATTTARSRHGFYAGQMSGSPASTHFDERVGTGGRFVSHPAEMAAPAMISPEQVFAFPAKVMQANEAEAPTNPTSPAAPTPSSPEPDPLGQAMGARFTPAPPTTPERPIGPARPIAGSARDLFLGADRTPLSGTTSTGDAGARASRPNTDRSSVGVDASVPNPESGSPAPLTGERVRATAPEPVAASQSTETPAPATGTLGAGADRTSPPLGRGNEGPRRVRWDDDPQRGGSCGGHQWHGAGQGGRPAAGAAMSTETVPATTQSRYWATGAHASAFVGAWLGGIPAVIGPLVVWLVRKDSDPFAAEHGRNALNFNLSVIVYLIAMVLLSIVTFGIGLLVTIPGFIALAVAWFAFTLVGTIKAASSEHYRYPLTIPFVK